MIKTAKIKTRNKRYCKVEFVVTLCPYPGCQFCKLYYNPEERRRIRLGICNACLKVKQEIKSNVEVSITPKKTYNSPEKLYEYTKEKDQIKK